MATNCNTPLSSLKASSSGSTNVGTVELFVDEKGYYTKENVATFVKAGKITPEEYAEITGDVYA